MNCFTHAPATAVGLCSICQKAICLQCVGREAPRLVCRSCIERGVVFGFEYVSPLSFGNWPLVHICTGIDPNTMRPKVAKGVIAVGNIAVGGVAIGGIACGLFTLGGASIGVLCALGGAALGVGLSIGGLAVGSVAVGGAALGFVYAIGGAAMGSAIIDGRQCDEAARLFVVRWLGASMLPPTCR
jgi:hypothetical protein